MATILVADDDAALLLVVTALLEEAGHRVLSAANGAEALRFAATESIQLLVTDVMMPVVNGFALAAILREHGEIVPVLFTSGVAESIPSGITQSALLPKPFNADDLLAAVDALLAGSSSRTPFAGNDETHSGLA